MKYIPYILGLCISTVLTLLILAGVKAEGIPYDKMNAFGWIFISVVWIGLSCIAVLIVQSCSKKDPADNTEFMLIQGDQAKTLPQEKWFSECYPSPILTKGPAYFVPTHRAEEGNYDLY